MTNESVIQSLCVLYKQKGFVTNEEIFEELISAQVSCVQTERICTELLRRGILISDEKGVSKIETLNDAASNKYDKAHIDYNGLYEKIVKKDKTLEFFVNYVRNIKPPQLHEVETLYPQIKSGNDFARKRLFEMNMRFVLKIAYQESKKFQLSLADTIQDGMLGLHAAIDKFDMSKHDNFQGYATFWIHNCISRNKNILDLPWIIPAHYQETIDNIYRYIRTYHKGFFKDFSFSETLVKEISKMIGSSEKKAIKNLSLISKCIDYDSLNIEDDNIDIDEIMYEKHLALQINNLLTTLKPRERQILKFRFGLYMPTDYDYKRMVEFVSNKIYKNKGRYNYSITLTLEEISSLYGLTRERVRQIELKALRKLWIKMEKLC